MITFSELEHLSLGDTIFALVEWWEISCIRMEVKERRDVRSGVWITLEFEHEGQELSVSGQSIWSVKKRLLETLKKLK